MVDVVRVLTHVGLSPATTTYPRDLGPPRVQKLARLHLEVARNDSGPADGDEPTVDSVENTKVGGASALANDEII